MEKGQRIMSSGPSAPFTGLCLADWLKIHRGIFAAAIDLELKLEPVAFVERRDARTLDRRNVNERVGLAIVALNEAEALHRIEELDRPAGLFTRQLALRASATSATATATATALDRHRLAFDTKVGRRDPAASIDKRELERLAVGKISQARLLDRRDVNEHILTAIIANDEAEAFLRIEEFDDAFAFADDLWGHSTAAAAKSAAAAAAAAESTAAATAGVAAATAVTVATASATATEAATAAIAAATLLVAEFAEIAFVAETFALVATAPAAVPLAPSIETHAPSELNEPAYP
jgi:hypothetical protein